MVLSVLVALILTPALCATILRPAKTDRAHEKGFAGWFNRNFDRGVTRYGRGVERANRRWGRTFIVYGLIVGGMALLFTTLPGGFLPDEDQGFLFTQVTLPTGSTAEQTEAVMAKVRHHITWSMRRPTSPACSPPPASASSASARTPAWGSPP